jgi:hypothetical protein
MVAQNREIVKRFSPCGEVSFPSSAALRPEPADAGGKSEIGLKKADRLYSSPQQFREGG